ncbi:MAG: DUF3570 domain-containing protein [Deltaproteobacteria bacterium]|nr:DUF3570 domain-containing protein [Deltaproteobacteria bacterium]
MQLSSACVAAMVLVCMTSSASAGDGEVTVSSAYYKERSTRVIQPMVDASMELDGGGELRAHTLLDAITSASPASGAAGQAFDEQRYELGSSYLHRLGVFRFGGGFRFSDEPDYQSFFVLARGSAELAQRNTTIGLTLARGFDDISNAGAQGGISQEISGEMDTTLASVVLSQILTPTIVASLTYDFIYVSGFQENAYRQVVAGGVLEAERIPDQRYRNAVFGSLRGFVPTTRTTLMAGYRFYTDDWGIRGHTPEARVTQEIIPGIDLEARYRFHGQTRADFYREIYDSNDPDEEPFLTADPKLSALRTHVIGGKLSMSLRHLGLSGKLGEGRGVALFEYYAQNTQFGDGVAAQLAVSLPFAF